MSSPGLHAIKGNIVAVALELGVLRAPIVNAAEMEVKVPNSARTKARSQFPTSTPSQRLPRLVGLDANSE